MSAKIFEYLFLFLIFPGFLFSVAAGLLIGWVDRKVTARIQWRVGPPWYQNFMDIAKLFYKETLVPEGVSRSVFLSMPLISMAGAALVSTIILVINGIPAAGFVGDLIVIVYLLIVPSFALMLGAFASANPLASLGASREMKLMLSYELPFILALIVPIIKTGYAIKLGDIILAQSSMPVIASVSGFLAFLVALLSVQAKLGFVPFDIAEAETEIMSGLYIEYSGKALAVLKMARAILIFAVPVLMVSLYFGGIRLNAQEFVRSAMQFLLVIVLMILIKNTNPRVRIDQAMRFFWGKLSILGLGAVILAYFGW